MAWLLVDILFLAASLSHCPFDLGGLNNANGQKKPFREFFTFAIEFGHVMSLKISLGQPKEKFFLSCPATFFAASLSPALNVTQSIGRGAWR